MSEINDLIVVKLQKYPKDVADLAKKAIELSDELPVQTVTEQLESVVRQIVRSGGAV